LRRCLWRLLGLPLLPARFDFLAIAAEHLN
jgi:hypothetical protein